ncbi:MAG: SDR family oxidoreductase [Anaerolineae bacterium]|jgi:hypothetical protein
MLDGYRTALITGASSGIGRSFARQLAQHGKDTILVARSEGNLNALAGELTTEHKTRAHVIVADLSVPHAAESLHKEVEALSWDVDLLINNAGFGKAGPFADLPFDVQARMIRLNVNTLVELSHLLLQPMLERGHGGIINISSTAAFQPVATMAVYGATKAFVLSFSESLAQEVAHHGIQVMALCPGATATNFMETAGVWEDRQERMPAPDEVVAAGLRAFEAGKRTYIPGALNRVAAFFASRVLPRQLVTRLSETWMAG